MRIGVAISLLLVGAPLGASDKVAPLLTATDLDPALVLPPPPVPGSAQAAAELEELRRVEATRSPQEIAAARADGDTKNATIFAEVLGPRFDLATLPRTARLMGIVRATENAVVDRGKAEFRRSRPYVVDPTLNPCKRNDDPLSSYPSGHTTMAFSMAEVLARLVPSKAPSLLARAARYGQTRIVCGQHFRSDVSAGETLGAIVAERLMAKPAFRLAFDAAQAELGAAGIAE
jgi:acid phosphatase (class A)